jgi:hypothetical protein
MQIWMGQLWVEGLLSLLMSDAIPSNQSGQSRLLWNQISESMNKNHDFYHLQKLNIIYITYISHKNLNTKLPWHIGHACS